MGQELHTLFYRIDSALSGSKRAYANQGVRARAA